MGLGRFEGGRLRLPVEARGGVVDITEYEENAFPYFGSLFSQLTLVDNGDSRPVVGERAFSLIICRARGLRHRLLDVFFCSTSIALPFFLLWHLVVLIVAALFFSWRFFFCPPQSCLWKVRQCLRSWDAEGSEGGTKGKGRFDMRKVSTVTSFLKNTATVISEPKPGISQTLKWSAC